MSEHTVEHAQLGEGDLLAYLEGTAAPDVARHIAACSRCRSDLVGLRAADALFSAALLRADCPSPDDLLALQTGFLPADQATVVQAHLDQCAECRADLALIATPPQPRLLDRLVRAGARLIQATAAPAPLTGPALRGSAMRRSTYTAGDLQVLLAITAPAAAGAPAQIEGQVMGADDQLADGTAEVRLLADDQPDLVEPVDDLGFFAFDIVTPGMYALALVIGGDTLVIEDVQVS